jgi:hypothetical protein
MSSTREVVLGAAALNTLTRKYKKKKKKRTGRNAKKRLHIFLDENKKAFLEWEDVPKPCNFNTCETFVEWCHISSRFPHYRHRLHCIADKANLHHCQLLVFKERCIKMCQHIYNTPFLKRNKCPPSIVQMVYVEVVLGKQVDQRTIEIQLMLNMIAHLELFVGLGRKYPHGVLEKKMATKEVPNPLVVWLDTSSDDEKTGCALVKRRLIEASIKGRMVENAFNNMVDNDNVEGPYLLLATEGRDYGHEGDGNGPTMDEGMPKVEAPIDLFGKISELEVELPTSRALVEEYKAKVEPGEVTFL